MSTRFENDYVKVEEAARLLNVTKRHVARLGALEEIRYASRGVVERASIDAYLHERRFSRTRAWDEETAWAAIALLSGLRVDWLGQVQTSRLRSRLRRLAANEDGPLELIGRARNRAVVRTYDSYEFLAPKLRESLVMVDGRRLGLVDRAKDQIDGYLEGTALAVLEKRYGLQRNDRGAMTLRASTFDIRSIKHIAAEGNGVLAAMDAATSMDAREHGVGVRALAAYLEEFARGRASE